MRIRSTVTLDEQSQIEIEVSDFEFADRYRTDMERLLALRMTAGARADGSDSRVAAIHYDPRMAVTLYKLEVGERVVAGSVAVEIAPGVDTKKTRLIELE